MEQVSPLRKYITSHTVIAASKHAVIMNRQNATVDVERLALNFDASNRRIQRQA